MTTAIEAVQSIQSVQAVTPPSTLGRVSHVAQVANSAFSVPSVILTLGAVSPVPLTYNAAGLFESLLHLTGTSGGASVSGVTHVDTSNIAGTATAAATAFSGTNSVANLATLLGYSATASSSDVLNNLVSSQTLPTTIGQALTSLLAQEFNPSSTIGTDMLTVNKALTHLLSSDPNLANTGLDTASAVSIFGTPNPLQSLSSDLTAQNAINSLLSDLGLAAGASPTTQQSLLTQLAANMTQTAAPLGSTGTNATTTTIGNDGIAISTVATTAGTIAATSATAATGVPATGTTQTPAGTATVVPAANVVADNNVTTNATSAPATSAVAGNVGANEVTSNTLTSNPIEAAAAQTLANIASNPSYANIAAALYLNAALFRSQHASDAALPNTAREPQPVTPVPGVKAVSLFPRKGSH